MGDISRNYLAKLSTESGAAVDADWNPAPDQKVFALAANETHLFAAGNFSSVGGLNNHWIAKLDLAGTGCADAGWQVRLNAPAFHLAVAGGNLYLGGPFLAVNEEPQVSLVRISTASAEVFRSPHMDFGTITALAAADGYVYLAGTFTQIDDIPVRFLARFSQRDGQIESIGNFTANGGVNITALAVSGTNIYAGGTIYHLKPGDPMYLARFSTITREWDNEWDSHANGTTRALALRGNDLFVAGEFIGIGGKANAMLALLPVFDGAPTVTPALTQQNQQTHSGLVIQPFVSDRAETRYFRIHRVTGGRLYKNDGSTELARGDFINLMEGAAGLRFTPEPGFIGTASLEISATVRNANPISGSSSAIAKIFVVPIDRAGLLAVRDGETLRLIWPSSTGAQPLDKARDLTPGLWTPVQTVPTRVDSFETLELDFQADRQFFRLRE